MSDILITGGTGLVGSAIKNGTKLSSKDGDLRKMILLLTPQKSRGGNDIFESETGKKLSKI